jgi:hypothetical protein
VRQWRQRALAPPRRLQPHRACKARRTGTRIQPNRACKKITTDRCSAYR